MRNIDEAWGVICELAGLEDTRIHDCRHSFAPPALVLGENLPMIGRLLGRSELQATQRYAHLDRDWVRQAAVRITPRASRVISYRDTRGQRPQRFRWRLERLWRKRKERA